ncbi:hypothetical protein REIFOR_01192 [Reinekea forsetii]|uniref:Uncharacterized protein n=1 Tax=Reinekea forsetii TaxID=1336806 RepID=A0A2K8KNF9_9GAMM|nr:hypothetical protein REIFOR_01192 [Reinekea forsetii]
MQTTGHVRRWNHNAIGRTRAAGLKVLLSFPVVVVFTFYLIRLVGFIHEGLYLFTVRLIYCECWATIRLAIIHAYGP